jgi:hypothetical protein
MIYHHPAILWANRCDSNQDTCQYMTHNQIQAKNLKKIPIFLMMGCCKKAVFEFNYLAQVAFDID